MLPKKKGFCGSLIDAYCLSSAFCISSPVSQIFKCKIPDPRLRDRSTDALGLHSRIDLDRTNLGNARLQGLPHDILGGDPTGHLFDWANSVFFISYVRSYSVAAALCGR